MLANINDNLLKNYIIKNAGTDHLTEKTALKIGISKDKFDEANVDENNYLELDEILEDSDLYEQFATLYVNDLEDKKVTKDEEAEKEKQIQVKDKNGAGV